MKEIIEKMTYYLDLVAQAFFATTVGQRVLLMLTPFVIMPHEEAREAATFSRFFRDLSAQIWAPLLGAGFLSGAVAATLRLLKKRGLPVDWFVNFDSVSTLAILAGGLAFAGYAAALTRTLSPRLMRLLGTPVPAVPFLYWCARYGGLLIFGGVIVWACAGMIFVRPGPWMTVLIVTGLSVLGVAARGELRRQRRLGNEALDAAGHERLHMIERLVFTGLMGLGAIALIWWVL